MGCCHSKTKMIININHEIKVQDFMDIIEWKEDTNDESDFEILCDLIKKGIKIKLLGNNTQAQIDLDILVKEFYINNHKYPST